MKKNTNFKGASCARCAKFVYAGNGVWHNFGGGTTLCLACDAQRDQQMKDRKAKRDYIKAHQLRLFK